MSSTVATRIDIRTIAPRDRHALIFDRFDALAIGGELELLNDHDPAPLRSQFEARSPGRFAWSDLEAGPDLWRVRVVRQQAVRVAVASDSCCSGGACGG